MQPYRVNLAHPIMKRFPLLLVMALSALLAVGCSSVEHYEVQLKQPNPYSSGVIRSQKKPSRQSESVLRFVDEHGQRFQIESRYVESIKAPPPGSQAVGAEANANYQINLTATNIYGVRVAYTPEKPVRATQRYYLLRRLDGRELKVPDVYVAGIESKTKKDLYEDPDPQFIEKFSYR